MAIFIENLVLTVAKSNSIIRNKAGKQARRRVEDNKKRRNKQTYTVNMAYVKEKGTKEYAI